jgi:hypothetical protein
MRKGQPKPSPVMRRRFLGIGVKRGLPFAKSAKGRPPRIPMCHHCRVKFLRRHSAIFAVQKGDPPALSKTERVGHPGERVYNVLSTTDK